MKKYKLAVLVSHPIQYQAPLFKKLAQRPEIDLMVYFCWNFGAEKESLDAEFGRKIKWDIPLLEGYRYKFLDNYSLRPSSEFWGQVNFGIVDGLIKNKYDAILVFGWNSFSNWLAFSAAFLTKTPVFLRGENPLNQELLKSKIKLKIKKIILGTLFKFISAFLYIGEENKKFYHFYGVPNDKLFFAPYAVDNERFIGEAEKLKRHRQKLRVKLGINKNDIVIFFVGKLIEKKRPMDLLKAYNILNSKFQIPNSSLVFVGDGVLRPELEKYAKENNLKNVYFAGFKNQTELPEHYAMADIFVLPSGAGETWGLAVNEAMCFGLPTVVSDMVGCGLDLVKNGENGYIFPFSDVDKLVSRLKDLIENGGERKSFGRKSFEIIQNYNYDKDIEGILTALKK